jgi:hypothetical protein
MTLNRRLNFRLSDADYTKLIALKAKKRANNEVLNISMLIRNELNKQLEEIL